MTSVKTTIQHWVEKYRCDPDDPIFALLEKMEEYHTEVRAGADRSMALEKEVLKGLIQTFDSKTQELLAASLNLSTFGSVFEKNAEVVAQSTDALTRYWKQIHLRHAFSGMMVSAILIGTAWGIFYYNSTDRLLSRAGIVLAAEAGKRGVKVTLTGKRLLASGQSESELVGEFSH